MMLSFFTWLQDNTEWLFSGLGLAIISFLFAAISYFISRLQQNRLSWEPKSPMKNAKPVKNISLYPKDYAFDVNAGDFSVKGYVSGSEALVQHIQRFILTKRGAYMIYGDEYGIYEADTIFKVRSLIEFKRQCQSIATHMLDYFSEWIEEIYSIHRKKGKLIIEFKVLGEGQTIQCIVPNINSLQVRFRLKIKHIIRQIFS